MTKPLLVTGATGFVGKRLVRALVERGERPRCGSRDPERARGRVPEADWVPFDLADGEGMARALDGARAAVYLVHLMAEGAGYAAREREAALAFREAAERAGVDRIVYLGGVEPQGPPSEHLQSRLDTGALLRGGSVPCVELRAGMIIGEGSESWRICRDLSARLPLMLLPRWLRSRSRPVAIDDIVVALLAALEIPLEGSRIFDVPGPEVLSAEQILVRAAALQGMAPRTLGLPVITPRLSSYWLKLVSGADYVVAQELVHGLNHDLLPSQPSIWDLVEDAQPLGFDDAVRRALEDQRPRSLGVRIVEGLARRLSPPTRTPDS